MRSPTRSFGDGSRRVSRPIVARSIPLSDGFGALRNASVLLSLGVALGASVAAMSAAANLEILGRVLTSISFYSTCLLRSTYPSRALGVRRADRGLPVDKDSQFGWIRPDESESSQHKGEAPEHHPSFGDQAATAPLDQGFR